MDSFIESVKPGLCIPTVVNIVLSILTLVIYTVLYIIAIAKSDDKNIKYDPKIVIFGIFQTIFLFLLCFFNFSRFAWRILAGQILIISLVLFLLLTLLLSGKKKDSDKN